MADNRLKDRIAIITGGSSGIGKATALRFAQCGARIVVADLKSSGVEKEITDKHGDHAAIFVKCDVTEESDIASLVKEAAKFGGRVDISCNFAGLGRPEGLRAHEVDAKDYDKVYAVNERGVWLSCKYALQQMMSQEPREPNARGEATRGWIINTASIYGLVAVGKVAAYIPSKFAVVGMTKQMGIDYAPDRIHVNCICPGYVRTPMLDTTINSPEVEAWVKSLHPWGSLGRPEDIADAALFLASDESAWMTGHALTVDGGYTCQ